ncbi:MAG TPA: WbqC family protein [Haliangiales bacterium]|nr:WbqC family protein [Haliangiales bacterium]
MTAVAIHQPEYFPMLGYLDKARRADVFVLLDDVQFDRSSLQHRARVAGAAGLTWMTIPFVHRFPQRLDEVEVADARFPVKHRKTLAACYGRAPGWAHASARLEALFAAAPRRLVDATVPSVEVLFEAFGVRPRVVRSSALGVEGDKAELVLAICRALGATRYLSGRTGAGYLDAEAFRAAGIAVDVVAFAPPDYPRLRPLPADARGLSALDAWFHLGADAPAVFNREPEAS